MSNIFEELQARKQKLVSLTEKAAEHGWIDTERKREIFDKLDKDTLTIGVIGQMKCGKSTFLNAFVFGKDILPAASTPMTAALSIITYGERERIVAEFYTKDEWEEQKMQAARSLDDVAGNATEESKVTAAKELVGKADKLGIDVDKYLGKNQEDDFSNLIEYVGADGKYISITKAVTIYYPQEYLKGVEIVDTPGFNDPIVSREERTKAFLNKADVVLMMLYAGQPFSATDRDILMKDVRQSGIGKVLVGINKYDIPYQNGETEIEIRDYVKEEIRKACKSCDDDSLVDILKQAAPIPLSAQMALLASLPMSEVTASEEYSKAWKRLCDCFEISNQRDMLVQSHMTDLTNAVKQMIENEKANILFKKPINAIMAAGNTIRQKNDADIQLAEQRLEVLNMPNDELDERKSLIDKAFRRLNKKVDNFGDDIDSALKDIIRKGIRDLEDQVDSACNRMTSIIETDFGRFTSVDSITPKLSAEITKLITRSLKRTCGDIRNDAERVIKRCVSDFMEEAEEVLRKYLPNVNSRDFVKKLKNNVELEISNLDMFSIGDTDDSSDTNLLITLWNGYVNIFDTITLGVFNAFDHNDNKRELLTAVNNISTQFDPKEYLESILNNKERLVSEMHDAFIGELINPLKEQLSEIEENKANKDKDIEDTIANLDKLRQQRIALATQFEEIESLKREIV